MARSVGLITNSITYYYRKKEDLASACFLRTIHAMGHVADQAMVMPEAPQRLRYFFQLLADLFARVDSGEHPPLALIKDLRALPGPQFDEVSKAYSQFFRQVRDLLKGPETAALGRGDLNARAYAVLSIVHWMRGWIGSHEVAEYPQVARRLGDIVVDGCAGTGSSWQLASEAELAWRFRENADPTAEAFLRATSALVNDQGYRGASVDKISAQLNVTKGSFYHHNDNKEDLVWACFERSFSIIRHAFDLAAADGGNGWERACSITRALTRFQLSAEGPILRLAAITALEDPERRSAAYESMTRLTQRMGGSVVDGMVDGSIRPIDPTLAGHIATGLISAAAGLHTWVPGVTEHNVGEWYVRPMFIGIFCPPSAP